jgi:hypothetical protein
MSRRRKGELREGEKKNEQKKEKIIGRKRKEECVE